MGKVSVQPVMRFYMPMTSTQKLTFNWPPWNETAIIRIPITIREMTSQTNFSIVEQLPWQLNNECSDKIKLIQDQINHI